MLYAFQCINNYWNNNNQPNYIYNTNTNVRKNLNITYPLKKIIFSINYISTYGEEVGILGSLPILGNWDQNNVFKLKWNSGHIWKGEIDVNNNMIEDFEFKFVILSENTVKIWENGENNKFDYDSLFNQIKNKKRGTYSKYDYEYNENEESKALLFIFISSGVVAFIIIIVIIICCCKKKKEQQNSDFGISMSQDPITLGINNH